MQKEHTLATQCLNMHSWPHALLYTYPGSAPLAKIVAMPMASAFDTQEVITIMQFQQTIGDFPPHIQPTLIRMTKVLDNWVNDN